jgi:glycosyltransferase involved in cell wall biosynthesis
MRLPERAAASVAVATGDHVLDGGVATTAPDALKVGILVVAYNAESTLAGVLDRVPKSFHSRISEIYVCDDASGDSTYLVGLGYQQVSNDLPLKVIRHSENLGYGGNQKVGYRMAIEEGLDIIVMLHGDGQYAPECLPDVIAPLERGEADCVMGSRMMEAGAARKGGMPLYKYVGNKVLTTFENKVLGTSLTEFHSGYRAYRVDALKAIAFERNSDNFNFDTQIIIQLVDAGMRIVEVPIPTSYGDEVCYVNGMKYARDVSADVVKYRLEKLGFGSGDFVGVDQKQALKQPDQSHGTILRWLEHRPPMNLLVLGGSGGTLSARVRHLGHTITAVDDLAIDGVSGRVGSFVRAYLDQGLPAEVVDGGPYDAVLCTEILEQTREPERLLREVRRVLVPSGVMIASVPNFGHWYPRIRTTVGLFDYDQRGVLFNGHVRFFTRRGLLHRLRAAGFNVVRQETIGLPLDALVQVNGKVPALIRILDRLLVALRPTFFGYQFVCICEPSTSAPVSNRPSA